MTTAHAPRVVALCGSVRAESRTRIALGEVLAAARDAGATTTLLDLRSYDLPPVYGPAPDPDDEAVAERARRLGTETARYAGVQRSPDTVEAAEPGADWPPTRTGTWTNGSETVVEAPRRVSSRLIASVRFLMQGKARKLIR